MKTTIPFLAVFLIFISLCTAKIQDKVIYGTDSRQDVYELDQSSIFAQRAKFSVVALFQTSFLGPLDQNGNYRILSFYNGDRLGTFRNLCSNQKFLLDTPLAHCTGSLIAADRVLTAAHCFESSDNKCNRTSLIFNYYATSRTEAGHPIFPNLTASDVYHCRNVYIDQCLDMAVIQLDRPVVSKYIPTPIQSVSASVELNTPLTMIGCPSAIPLKVAGDAIVTDVGTSEMKYFRGTLDAFGGNSGSPVYDNSGLQIGILLGGAGDYVLNGSCYVVHQINDCVAEGDCGERVGYAFHAITDVVDCQTSADCGGNTCDRTCQNSSCTGMCLTPTPVPSPEAIVADLNCSSSFTSVLLSGSAQVCGETAHSYRIIVPNSGSTYTWTFNTCGSPLDTSMYFYDSTGTKIDECESFCGCVSDQSSAAIVRDLSPGTYYISITGNNGATGRYNLNVACSLIASGTPSVTPTSSRTQSLTPSISVSSTRTPSTGSSISATNSATAPVTRSRSISRSVSTTKSASPTPPVYTAVPCHPSYPTCCSENVYSLGDSSCDSSLNTLQCGWDGGDCCGSSCVSLLKTCNASLFDCKDSNPVKQSCMTLAAAVITQCSTTTNSVKCLATTATTACCTAFTSYLTANCKVFLSDTPFLQNAGCSNTCGTFRNCANLMCSVVIPAVVLSETASIAPSALPISNGSPSPTQSPNTGCHPTRPLCCVKFPQRIGDGYCDTIEYNTPECGYDGGDCCYGSCKSGLSTCGSNGYTCYDPVYIHAVVPSSTSTPTPTARVVVEEATTTCLSSMKSCCVTGPKYIGDGYCDPIYNTAACGYDGGDCCYSSCRSVFNTCGRYNCTNPTTRPDPWVCSDISKNILNSCYLDGCLITNSTTQCCKYNQMYIQAKCDLLERNWEAFQVRLGSPSCSIQCTSVKDCSSKTCQQSTCEAIKSNITLNCLSNGCFDSNPARNCCDSYISYKNNTCGSASNSELGGSTSCSYVYNTTLYDTMCSSYRVTVSSDLVGVDISSISTEVKTAFTQFASDFLKVQTSQIVINRAYSSSKATFSVIEFTAIATNLSQANSVQFSVKRSKSETLTPLLNSTLSDADLAINLDEVKFSVKSIYVPPGAPVPGASSASIVSLSIILIIVSLFISFWE